MTIISSAYTSLNSFFIFSMKYCSFDRPPGESVKGIPLNNNVIFGGKSMSEFSSLLILCIIFRAPSRFSLLLTAKITNSSANKEILIPDISEMPALESINKKSGRISFLILSFMSRKNPIPLLFSYKSSYQLMEDSFFQYSGEPTFPAGSRKSGDLFSPMSRGKIKCNSLHTELLNRQQCPSFTHFSLNLENSF